MRPNSNLKFQKSIELHPRLRNSQAERASASPVSGTSSSSPPPPGKDFEEKSANHCNLIIEKFLTSSDSIFRCSSSGGEELSHDAEEQLPGDAEEEDEGTGKSIDIAG